MEHVLPAVTINVVKAVCRSCAEDVSASVSGCAGTKYIIKMNIPNNIYEDDTLRVQAYDYFFSQSTEEFKSLMKASAEEVGMLEEFNVLVANAEAIAQVRFPEAAAAIQLKCNDDCNIIPGTCELLMELLEPGGCLNDCTSEVALNLVLYETLSCTFDIERVQAGEHLDGELECMPCNDARKSRRSTRKLSFGDLPCCE